MKKNLLLIITCLFLISLVSCNKTKANEIVVGASPSPHAEILEETRDYLLEKGYKLVIKKYTDYIIPNVALSNEELDANFFQHAPYLADYNKKNNTDLIEALKVHYEFLGLYKGKKDSIENISKGPTICIPNDTTNFSRALLLLQELGLITVDESKGFSMTLNDIITNKFELTIKTAEAAAIPHLLTNFDFAVINGNYALSSGLTSENVIAFEDINGSAPNNFINILVTRPEMLESDKIKVLIEALLSEKIKSFINEKYQGSVLLYNK